MARVLAAENASGESVLRARCEDPEVAYADLEGGLGEEDPEWEEALARAAVIKKGRAPRSQRRNSDPSGAASGRGDEGASLLNWLRRVVAPSTHGDGNNRAAEGSATSHVDDVGEVLYEEDDKSPKGGMRPLRKIHLGRRVVSDDAVRPSRGPFAFCCSQREGGPEEEPRSQEEEDEAAARLRAAAAAAALGEGGKGKDR